ncbi:amidohydrolase [Croceibacterium mercuriale]|uniref:Amidohydrolase n=1 Tax=Croceibacterium mercuriale TaxID=1572751 RepID=A0A0B2BYK6_9SPHN|nr:amidohydrolase family protein [Croceibacterium mercuriale]KHL26544.1 amidohydrolase [Croceibacterium mercuriale]
MKRALLGAAALLLAVPAGAQTIAITGGTVAIGDGSQPIPNGTVILRDGRVIAAGSRVAVPAGARTIDATGKWVSPGLVVGLAPVGLVEVSGVEETDDTDPGKSPFSAAIDVASAINPRAQPLQVTRAEGYTRAIVGPVAGNSIFAGQGAIIDLGTDMDALMQARAFQYAELGQVGGRNVGGGRPGVFAYLRNALFEAEAYRRDQQALSPALRTGHDGFERQLTRLDAAALVAVVDGSVPLFVNVNRASDILTVLRFNQEFPAIRLVLVGAHEGWMVAPQIAAAGVPVITTALTDLPETFESLAATRSNVGRLRAAGVKVALRTTRNTAQEAGNLVALAQLPGATGLDWGAAFATITSAPAEIVGMGAEFGSLLPGRRADVVIWDGDPLEVQSGVEQVFIDGVEQSLDTHMSRLRDRYRQAQPGSLPKAYER